MRKLAIFAGVFAGATAFYVYLWQDIRVLYIAGGCLLLSAVFQWMKRPAWCIVFLALAAGLIWCRGYDQIWLAPLQKLDGTEQVLTMEVRESVMDERYGWVQIRVQGRNYDAILYGKLGEVTPGDRLIGPVRAELDQEATYLRRKGAALKLYADQSLTVERGEPPLPVQVRLWVQEKIDTLYTGENAGLLQALLTGDQSGITEAVRTELSVAGLSHAMAVSGMHVSMLMTMLAFCCGGNPRLTAILGIPMACFFTLMTGASPSSCRAAVMQILLLSAPLFHRERDSLTSLGLAGMVLLLENPWVISNVSFQLSFSAVAGLLLLAQPIQQRLLSLWKSPGRLARFLSTSLAASLGATAFTLPFTVYYFDLVSLVAVVSNLLCLWAVTGAFMLGLLSCFLPIAHIPVKILTDWILLVCRLMGKFPYGAVYPQNLPLMVWAICAYGAVYWLLLGRKRKPAVPVLALSVAFVICAFWGRFGNPDPAYRVLDVGQGQCTLLEAGALTAVMDCGGEDPEQAGNLLVQTLHSQGKAQVDVLILTHYDADHAGGAIQFLRRVKAGLVILPDIPDDTGMREAIEESAREAGSQVLAVTDQMEVTFSGGKLTVYPPLSMENDNNMGICVLATVAEYDILVTGDVDHFVELQLLAAYDLPQVEILVAGHHGAETSTSQALLDTVRPKAVVISVGQDNSYGHPDPQTLLRIQKSGAKVYRTDQQGTLIFHP